MATAKPDMSIIWAAAGTAVKPADSKIQQGWQAEKPPFQTENWSQQRQDQYLKHLDEHGVPEWSNTSEYLTTSIVWYQDKLWESLQPINIGNAPLDGAGFWRSQSYVDKRGDIMSGPLDIKSRLRVDVDPTDPSPSADIHFFDNGFLRSKVSYFAAGEKLLIQTFNTAGIATHTIEINPTATGLNRFLSQGFGIWTAGTDGAGSGMDADLLDGMQLQDILNLITQAGTSGSAFRQRLNSGTYTVPAGVTSCTFTLVGGGGGGGGGGDGGTSSGSAGGSGGSTIMTVPAGSITMTARGGGGGGGGSSGFVSGAGGLTNFSDWLQGTLNLGQTDFLGENGFPSSQLGNPAKGGNGGAGMFGLRGIGTTGSNSNSNGSVGNAGGGGAGSWGQDSAPGGGGASGAAMVQTISLVTGDVFTIAIGNPGLGGNGVSANRKGSDGGFGIAIVDYNS